MKRLLIPLLVLAAHVAHAAPAPTAVFVDVEFADVRWGVIFDHPLAASQADPGGLLVAADSDPQWFAFGFEVGDVIVDHNHGRASTLFINEGRHLFGLVRKGAPVLLQLTIHGGNREIVLTPSDLAGLQQVHGPYSTPIVRNQRVTGVRLNDSLLPLYSKLQIGDVVRMIDQRPIRDDAELVKAMQHLRVGKTAVTLERFGRTLTITLVREPLAQVAQIKRVDDNTYQIPQAIIDSLVHDEHLAVAHAKAAFFRQDATLHGIKIYDLEPGSLYGAIGLQDEDVILEIEGLPLDTTEQVYHARYELMSATRLAVTVLRRGRKLAMTYQVVP